MQIIRLILKFGWIMNVRSRVNILVTLIKGSFVAQRKKLIFYNYIYSDETGKHNMLLI